MQYYINLKMSHYKIIFPVESVVVVCYFKLNIESYPCTEISHQIVQRSISCAYIDWYVNWNSCFA